MLLPFDSGHATKEEIAAENERRREEERHQRVETQARQVCLMVARSFFLCLFS